MVIKPIKTEAEHGTALRQIERLWGAEEGTREGDQLEVLATLVGAYEQAHFPIDAPDPIEAIKFRLEQQGTPDRRRVPHYLAQVLCILQVREGKKDEDRAGGAELACVVRRLPSCVAVGIFDRQ